MSGRYAKSVAPFFAVIAGQELPAARAFLAVFIKLRNGVLRYENQNIIINDTFFHLAYRLCCGI